jgi:hypothetical protein
MPSISLPEQEKKSINRYDVSEIRDKKNLDKPLIVE